MNKTWVVAVPSCAPGGIDAEISGHFGHCDLFTLVEIDNGAVTKVDALPGVSHQHGGCMVPVEFLANRGIENPDRRRHGDAAPPGLQSGRYRRLRERRLHQRWSGHSGVPWRKLDAVLAGIQLRQPRRRRLPGLGTRPPPSPARPMRRLREPSHMSMTRPYRTFIAVALTTAGVAIAAGAAWPSWAAAAESAAGRGQPGRLELHPGQR